MASIDDLPPFIEVEVQFYDSAEKQVFESFPAADSVRRIVPGIVRVPTPEFLSYFLFHRKRVGSPAYRSYAAMGQKLEVALALMDGCLVFGERSIRTAPGVDRQLIEISEHVGEAVGLSVANRIHDFTEADWSPIEQEWGRRANPTFDFELASDEKYLIQVETKGTSDTDNRTLSTRVKAHKRNITTKKQKLSSTGDAAGQASGAAIRYGTITALDARPDSRIVCRLVDPPAQPGEFSARKVKLLKRLHFIHRWISFVSPRTELASALATRLFDLVGVTNPFELDSLPLRRASGEPFEQFPYDASGHSTFATNKSKVTDGPAAGVVVQLSKKALFFAGIREDFWQMAALQNFTEILAYRAEVGSIDKTVECVISRGRFDGFALPPSIANEVEERGSYIVFRLPGRLHYSPSGLVFGLLALPDKYVD